MDEYGIEAKLIKQEDQNDNLIARSIVLKKNVKRTRGNKTHGYHTLLESDENMLTFQCHSV